MRRIFLTLFSLICISAGFAQSLDLKSILGGLTGNSGDNSTVSTVTGILGNLLSSDKVSVADMAGTWNYSSPAVSFKSENLLMKAGGSAAASTIESKLAPYYKTAGIESMVLTVNSDSTFTMKVKAITLKGTISAVTDKESQANFVFNFQALGKISVGKMDTYVTMTGKNSMNLLFDVSKLVDILSKVATLSGNSTIKGVTSLLNNYDGICAGFKLSKTN
ncbi:MAG: DUF4923 family protein [Paramuribaculum sp.]|nr:DUF4923 family protein [Paramuribaculum sp.]